MANAKELHFDVDARAGLKRGVDQLAPFGTIDGREFGGQPQVLQCIFRHGRKMPRFSGSANLWPTAAANSSVAPAD